MKSTHKAAHTLRQLWLIDLLLRSVMQFCYRSEPIIRYGAKQKQIAIVNLMSTKQYPIFETIFFQDKTP